MGGRRHGRSPALSRSMTPRKSWGRIDGILRAKRTFASSETHALTYSNRKFNLTCHLCLGGIYERRRRVNSPILPYPEQISGRTHRSVVAMRDSLNATSTGNLLRRLVLGSQPALQRVVCKAKANGSENLRRPTSKRRKWLRE